MLYVIDYRQHKVPFRFSFVLHHGRSSLGPEFEAIQVVITSASISTSSVICACKEPDFAPNVLPTSFATASHGVPAVRFDRSSLPRFTTFATDGGTFGTTCGNMAVGTQLKETIKPTISGESNMDAMCFSRCSLMLSHKFYCKVKSSN